MNYIPHHQRAAKAAEAARSSEMRSAAELEKLTGRVCSLLGRLSIDPSKAAYIEVLRPATVIERRFNNNDLMHRQASVKPGKFVYQWRVSEMVLGILMPGTYVSAMPHGDGRTPDGYSKVIGSMLVASDGRLWTAGAAVAPSTYQVIETHAMKPEDLGLETLQKIESFLANR